MLKIDQIRKDFPVLGQKINGKPLVYLDSAATSQKPKSVIEALSNYYRKDNANIHRGVHTLAERATAAYEESRRKVAEFIGAAHPREIVFTRGTTESINLVSYAWGRQNLKRGDTVLLTVMEHHSNLVPWQLLAREIGIKLEFIPVTAAGGLEDPEEAIRKIKPKLLSFGHVSNVLGTENPVKKMVRAGHEIGATVLVDGAQAVPHLPVNVQSLGADFYAFSGHKMLGPTGIGVLYAREGILESMPPFMGGGEMIREVHLRKSSYKEPPYKFEAGTPHIAGAIGLGAAVDYLDSLGMENVQKHGAELMAHALEVLGGIEGLTVYGPADPASRSGAVAFTVKGIHPHDLATILDREGIAVRSGNHCTMPLHDHLGVIATARASFSVYTAKEEIDALAAGIGKARKTLLG